jgi:hypothetical protein
MMSSCHPMPKTIQLEPQRVNIQLTTHHLSLIHPPRCISSTRQRLRIRSVCGSCSALKRATITRTVPQCSRNQSLSSHCEQNCATMSRMCSFREIWTRSRRCRAAQVRINTRLKWRLPRPLRTRSTDSRKIRTRCGQNKSHAPRLSVLSRASKYRMAYIYTYMV